MGWLTGSGTGLGLLAGLHYRRWWRRRLDSAEGAPPSGLDPRAQKDVGVLAWWKDEIYEYEMVDPTPEVVLGAVRVLDGENRSIVSVYRGKVRLDVAGDAGAEVLVQQSDDRRTWHQVTSVAGVKAPKVWVNVVGFAVTYPADRLTDLRGAEVAMATWLANGRRDGSLGWWDDSSLDMAERPKYLKDTD